MSALTLYCLSACVFGSSATCRCLLPCACFCIGALFHAHKNTCLLTFRAMYGALTCTLTNSHALCIALSAKHRWLAQQAAGAKRAQASSLSSQKAHCQRHRVLRRACRRQQHGFQRVGCFAARPSIQLVALRDERVLCVDFNGKMKNFMFACS